MSVVKVIEIISEGTSVENAIQAGVTEAAKTIHQIKQVNVEHIEGHVENNKISKYRIHLKLSFIVESHKN